MLPRASTGNVQARRGLSHGPASTSPRDETWAEHDPRDRPGRLARRGLRLRRRSATRHVAQRQRPRGHPEPGVRTVPVRGSGAAGDVRRLPRVRGRPGRRVRGTVRRLERRGPLLPSRSRRGGLARTATTRRPRLSRVRRRRVRNPGRSAPCGSVRASGHRVRALCAAPRRGRVPDPLLRRRRPDRVVLGAPLLLAQRPVHLRGPVVRGSSPELPLRMSGVRRAGALVLVVAAMATPCTSESTVTGTGRSATNAAEASLLPRTVDALPSFDFDQDQRAGAIDFLERYAVSYPSVADAGEIHDRLGFVGLPDTVFYAADGSIASTWAGPITADALDERLAQLTGSSSSCLARLP